MAWLHQKTHTKLEGKNTTNSLMAEHMESESNGSKHVTWSHVEILECVTALRYKLKVKLCHRE